MAEPRNDGGRKIITLALQGGGTHGAFTWGVLDRLLEEDRLFIEAISATSAGAMNAAMMAYGIMKGGRRGARELLARFWWHVSEVNRFNPVQPTPLDRVMTGWGVGYSPVYIAAEAASRIWSPYQLNPLGLNPIRPILRTVLDFDELRRCEVMKLFVSATNVRTGKVKIFETSELTEDVLIASSCLPNVFQAVEIDGECYWDGGYVANPAIYPLMRHCDSSEVVIVQVNPMTARQVPQSASDILDRINDISFNASVMREMHAIAFLTSLLDKGYIDPRAGVRRTHIHMIHDEETMSALDSSSKVNGEQMFLDHLYQRGRERADSWLANNFDLLGHESTIDISEVYL